MLACTQPKATRLCILFVFIFACVHVITPKDFHEVCSSNPIFVKVTQKSDLYEDTHALLRTSREQLAKYLLGRKMFSDKQFRGK
jgi:hypothetical protein